MGKNSLVSIIYNETVIQLFGFSYNKPPLCVLEGIDSPPYVAYVNDQQAIHVGSLINNMQLNHLIASFVDLLLKIDADRSGISVLSRNGTYANENYKRFANSKGVYCIYTGYNGGWYVNSCCELVNRISQACQLKLSALLNANSQPRDTTKDLKVTLPDEKSTRTHTYICPVCGKEVHSATSVDLYCGNCDVALVPIV